MLLHVDAAILKGAIVRQKRSICSNLCYAGKYYHFANKFHDISLIVRCKYSVFVVIKDEILISLKKSTVRQRCIQQNRKLYYELGRLYMMCIIIIDALLKMMWYMADILPLV